MVSVEQVQACEVAPSQMFCSVDELYVVDERGYDGVAVWVRRIALLQPTDLGPRWIYGVQDAVIEFNPYADVFILL